MGEVKWIKIVTDIFDDEKIRLIESMPEADAIIVIWFKLLCVAGKANYSGLIMLNEKTAYTDEMLSTIFRRPLNIIRMALKVFEQFDMIEVVNNTFAISKWEKHQNVEGLDKVREQARIRQQDFRDRQKQKTLGNVTHNVTDNVTVTPSNDTDIDLELEEELDVKDNTYADSITFKNDVIKINIFNAWIDNNIMNHRKLTDKMKRKIDSRLRDYSEEEIIQSISNYGRLLKSTEHFFNYRWSLVDFLDRGLDKMMDWDIVDCNYKKNTAPKDHHRSKIESVQPTYSEVEDNDVTSSDASFDLNDWYEKQREDKDD